MSVDRRDLGLLLERSAQALVLTNDHGRWLWVNQAAAELLGRSRRALLTTNRSDWFPDWPAVNNGRLTRTVYRRPDGVEWLLWIEQLPLWLEHPYQLWAIYALPPQHLYPQPVDPESLYYRTLFELLPVGVGIIDANGKITASNPASELILGIPVSELVKYRIDDPGLCSLPPDERPVVRAWKNRQVVTNQTLHFVRPDGSECCLSVNAAPLPNGGLIVAYVDITEQEQAKAALRQSQVRFQRIADMFPGVIYTVVEDEQGPQAYEYLSPAFTTIYGLAVEQAYQNPSLVYGQIHPEDRISYQRALREALMHNELFQHEWRIVTPNGQVKWLRGFAQAEWSQKGEVRWHGIALDITDRKQAELALERQMATERSLCRVMQAMRSSLDLDGIFRIAATTISQEFQLEVHIVEYVPQDRCWRFRVNCNKNGELFTPAVQEIPAADNPFSAELLANRIVQVDDTNTISDPVNQRLGQDFPGAWLLVPIVVNSQVWGSLSLMRLGTDAQPWLADAIALGQRLSQHLGLAIEQAQMHRQLQTSQQELQWLLENSPSVTVRLRLYPNYQAVYEYISPQCEQVMGYRPEEFLANPKLWYQRIPPEDVSNIVLPVHERIYQGETDHHFCYRFRDRDGRMRWIQQSVRVLPKGSEPYWSLIISALDVTDLYSARAQIEELARLNQMKDDFVSTVSHELRTPLSSIRMATRMIEMNLQRRGLLSDDPNDSLVKYLNILKQQTEQEVNLINDLLDLARLQAGARCPTLVSINLATFLPPLVAPFQEQARQQQQTLQLDIADDVPPVLVHIPYLERIVNELLTNACKYTPPGETITLRVNQDEQGVYLQVINTGVEIPEAEQARVFERFYRLSQHDRWKRSGTGLGLALVKELVERLGGRITLESGQGQVCFTVWLRGNRSASTDPQNGYQSPPAQKPDDPVSADETPELSSPP